MDVVPILISVFKTNANIIIITIIFIIIISACFISIHLFLWRCRKWRGNGKNFFTPSAINQRIASVFSGLFLLLLFIEFVTSVGGEGRGRERGKEGGIFGILYAKDLISFEVGSWLFFTDGSVAFSSGSLQDPCEILAGILWGSCERLCLDVFFLFGNFQSSKIFSLILIF